MVTKTRTLTVAIAAVFLLTWIACGAAAEPQRGADSRPGPSAEVAAVRDLGPLEFLKVIRGRDGGFSARWGDRSIWTFGDTVLGADAEDGTRWRSSTWCWTRDFDAADGLSGLEEPVDAKGAPGEFLQFTKAELEYNQVHNRQDVPEKERSRYALWPGPVAIDPATGKACVFYVKIFARTGPWDFEAVGHSIALWESPEKPVTRPEVRPNTDDPTILFPKGDAVLGQGAVVVGDWVYAYGCETKDLSWPCIVARVKPAEVLRREAWRFYAGDDRWNEDWHEAVSVMQAAPMLTVHWNAHLGKYLAVYGSPLLNTIAIRTADRPEGPWSDSREVFECLAPTNPKIWCYSNLAHPEFARENGRIEYFTYYRETGFLQGEVRLVEVEFRDKP